MTAAALAASGFVLGWSVAWPPGPINAEAVRRGLARRFWPAYAVVIGGCVGDAIWALAVGSGSGLLVRLPGLHTVLGVASIALLIVLSALFFRGAQRAHRTREAERAAAPDAGQPVRRSLFDGARGSFALGFTLAATGPWNLAFWLAAIGQADVAGHGWTGTLALAAGVLAGAASWGIVLCLGVTRLGARFANPAWMIATQLGTGVLMLLFALRTAVRLLEG